MIISIASSGGIGGFGLKKSVTVQTDDLPAGIQSEACTRLAPDVLGALDKVDPGMGADMIIYRIEVTEEGAAMRSFSVPEAALPPETLDVIDDLMNR